MDKWNTRATIKNTSFLSTFFDKTKEGKSFFSYRMKRWIVVISIHLLFFLSFAIDIQTLEGTLNGSRILGFHLIDPFTTIQVFLATYHLPINVIIGTSTIIIFYLFVGGKSYCSWVCPYGIISEIGEKLHNTLVTKKIIKERKFDHRVRHIFWFMFIIMAFTSGYLVFETFNVVGILSRFIAYGWSLALGWVLIVFLLEVFFSRRAWCTYLCPIGTTYGYIGKVSALRVQWNDNCDHCMVCHDVCFENQVLDLTKAKYDKQREEKGIKTQYVTGADCTLCGRCIDVCHADALKFDFRLKGLV
ncbi:NapH/MauN family ferredoxin-type protein [Poseidonibacter ostreae]|jgi:ferredoxin-type protein NapH|uniref:NapH/MauN family ferredoxin-type protein n=1 Tax=Poseidonibacter ostreae TaxID=2654171 RepID=A0A6L4WUV9_9BACT|nr:NapH/MauN family ferredoxin-type protein [Poseidonibacter ostreae]KAB7886451.1 NapH/MauN family ferredoxin-type protein [Poseidonibacter ostreae]KAB7890178.1 NapH/MauN family ferredoxin-type protein [Poseidonibacter ostreae]KAB7892575.1 NapH/MauN family ferredoxin-type protein [Poseidonibacter ostreae]MAC83837.1 ferredoxin [Arcobacter sp.]